VREWPVDASTLTRFALYLAIPVGSWLGGALVERLVNALLD
jgi:predicted MFS family arabinose efflux permease